MGKAKRELHEAKGRGNQEDVATEGSYHQALRSCYVTDLLDCKGMALVFPQSSVKTSESQ